MNLYIFPQFSQFNLIYTCLEIFEILFKTETCFSIETAAFKSASIGDPTAFTWRNGSGK